MEIPYYILFNFSSIGNLEHTARTTSLIAKVAYLIKSFNAVQKKIVGISPRRRVRGGSAALPVRPDIWLPP